MTQCSLSRSEAGLRTFSYDEVCRIARALALPQDRLLGAGPPSLRRHRRRRAGPDLAESEPLARRAGSIDRREFVARGGALRALQAAVSGRQPLPAAQARIILEMLPDAAAPAT
jgi:hypothetical protein